MSLRKTTSSEDNIHMFAHSLLHHHLWVDSTDSVHGGQTPFIFMGGRRGDICFIQLKGLGFVYNFHYSWDFCVRPKVIILIISDCLFPHLIDLCKAHLSAACGVTFLDRGRMADGQQMGVLPCFVVQSLAQAWAVRDCQFVLSACGLHRCIWHLSHSLN